MRGERRCCHAEAHAICRDEVERHRLHRPGQRFGSVRLTACALDGARFEHQFGAQVQRSTVSPISAEWPAPPLGGITIAGSRA